MDSGSRGRNGGLSKEMYTPRAELTSGAKPPVFAKPKQHRRGYNTYIYFQVT